MKKNAVNDLETWYFLLLYYNIFIQLTFKSIKNSK